MQPEPRPLMERNLRNEPILLSLRKRMEYTRALLAFGGVVSFVGFVLLALAFPSPSRS